MNHLETTHKKFCMFPLSDMATLSAGHRRQTGASLIVSLMLLVVLTLLGLSGMQSTIMQERMSNNVRDKNLSFQAAESAVREAEDWITAFSSGINRLQPNDNCIAPCNFVNLNNYPDMITQSFSWWESNGRPHNDIPVGTGGVVASAPRFIVERHSDENIDESAESGTNNNYTPVRTLFRITAIGVGGTATAESMIETLYARID